MSKVDLDCVDALEQVYTSYDNGETSLPPAVQAHLDECHNCQRLVSLDQKLVEGIRTKSKKAQSPSNLALTIESSLKHLERNRPGKLGQFLPGRSKGWISISLVMLAVLALIGYQTIISQPSLAEWGAGLHVEYASGKLILDQPTTDPNVLNSWFVQSVGRDLNLARFTFAGLGLVGGKKLDYSDQSTGVVFLTKGKTPVSLLAFPSADLNLKDLSQNRENARVLWFGSLGKLNLAAWKEPEQKLTCILISELSVVELLSIAASL